MHHLPEKLAAQNTRDKQDARVTADQLRPGDILLTSPRRDVGWIDRAYNEMSRRVQGTRFGHAALYVGDGRVVDARFLHGVKERSLGRVLRENHVVAAQPRVSDRQRERAVAFARSLVGAPYAAHQLARAALPNRAERQRLQGGAVERLRRQGVICSGLVAHAYDSIRFSQAAHHLVRPAEILQAKRVAVLGRLKREKK